MATNQLQNICVFIEDEKQLHEARELLERFGQPIANRIFFKIDYGHNYLLFDEDSECPDWMMYYETEGRQKITLTELEKLLEDELRKNS